MNVLIIPEDFRKDQYVLKPLVEAMMAAAGRPRANVRVCQEPLMGDVNQALKWERIQQVLERYRGMVDLYLLLVDRDGEPHRRERIDKIEIKAAEVLPASRALFGENAWQEIEVWVLAGHDIPNEWAWAEVRAHPHPKEAYFEPFSRSSGLSNTLGGGRQSLARVAAARYERVRQLCPEDVGALEKRIRNYLAR
ncbi:hypothetical protein [Archangium sp.]|uniref:hypothetical protein n=1 Tax=Archangium sp. TaxID=1872627 RepID=UPI002D6FD0BC|nr:hypothetical protein [Archangium sp.]HYO56027.1 hypothetical protein [Archangium sp.]